jgi:cyclase
MLKKRIIPTLLLNNKQLVKTIKFSNLRYIGDPLNAIKIFNEKFVDELIILDISKQISKNFINYNFLKDLFSECFVPVTYGGGVSTLKEADRIFKLGVEKICINSAVLKDQNIIKEFSRNFGSQSIVVSVDIYRNIFNKIYIYNYKKNKKENNLNLIEYLKQIENLGAGEILINSVNKDGTMLGMDLNLIKMTNNIVSLPIIYSGGIGSIEDIKNALKHDISGISAGSFFFFYGPHKAVLISYPYEEFKCL